MIRLSILADLSAHFADRMSLSRQVDEFCMFRKRLAKLSNFLNQQRNSCLISQSVIASAKVLRSFHTPLLILPALVRVFSRKSGEIAILFSSERDAFHAQHALHLENHPVEARFRS